MEFSVPTNWQNELIEKLNKANVVEIYGKQKQDIIGGGRRRLGVPYVNRQKVQEYVALVHAHGLKFNYLLNSVWLNNIEWSIAGQRQIRRLLDWLAEINVDSITVSLPFLLQLIKSSYPVFEVNVSVMAGISAPKQASWWEEMGADQITLGRNLARKFNLLKQFRSAVACRLQLIANSPCCVSGHNLCNYHDLQVSHDSQIGSVRRDLLFNYSALACRFLLFSEPHRLLSDSGWIRPEDIYAYEAVGINSLKFIDRTMGTEQILQVVEAYTSRKYKGNLCDLLFPRISNGRVAKNPLKNLASYAISFSIGSRRKVKLCNALAFIMGEAPIYLDNQKLEGFLEYFLDNKCDNCIECGYCKKIAEKCIQVPSEHRERVLSLSDHILKQVADGSWFRNKGYYEEKE